LVSAGLTPPLTLRFCHPGNSSAPAAGFKLFAYRAGTSIKQVAWADSTRSVCTANPVRLDSAGGATLWLEPGLSYRLVLAHEDGGDPPAHVLWTQDNVQSPSSGSTGGTPSLTPRHPRSAAEIAAGVTPIDDSYAPLDVRRYGADPGGTQPSDAALAKAIAVCGASGGTIRVPAGVYNFSGQINLEGRRSITISGEGAATGGAQAATRFNYTGTDDRAFINMNSAVGCQLRGLHITHRDPHYTGVYIKCTNAGTNDPALCALLDCVLGSHVGRGNVHLDLDRCIQFTAERCAFSYGNPSVRGRDARGYSNVIRFRDCQWASCHSAPVQEGGQSWTFEGCTFEGLLSGAPGALYATGPETAFNGLAVIGCWFGDATAAGTWLDIACNGALISGNYISGNTATAKGIALRASVGVQITGNLFDQLLAGIEFAGTPSRDIVIQANIANLVRTGLGNTGNVPTGSLVWGPNYGLGVPGNTHQRLAADGCVADAASGVLRQWGAQPLTGGTTHAISFPIRFPSQCFNVVTTLSAVPGTACVSRIGPAGFEATVQGVASGTTLYWQALGN
jgi:hypothetical protein